MSSCEEQRGRKRHVYIILRISILGNYEEGILFYFILVIYFI